MNTDNKRLHGQTLASKTYRELHQAPKFGRELTGDIKSPQLYQLVDELEVVPKRSEYGRYQSEPIEDPVMYYLWGDERQAVRKIVETYPHYVLDCMEHPKNPLKKAWEDVMWELLAEEWQYADYENKND